ncbi:MAG: glycosyltransferase [Fimbriimonadaceae bacterium]
MTNLPLVSVIIPSYNRAEFLGEAIDSVLAQTYTNIEIIVVDDGSKDDSVEVARSYGDRIDLIERENGGVSAARNSGIAKARGTYISLLDGDDRMLPDCVEARVGILEEDSSLGVCAGSCAIMSEDGIQTGSMDIRNAVPAGDPFRSAVRSYWGATSGVVYRRSALIECGGFDPLIRVCEDWDVFVRVAAKHRFRFDPTPRAEYRMVPGSLSKSLLPMYDGAATMMRKNRILARSYSSYFIDSLIGMNTHCTGVVFSRLKDGLLGPGAGKAVLGLALRRPMVFVFGSVWMIRAIRNRILWLFGMGPLRRKPV